MSEIWKDIIGYENVYQISNLGNVRRLETFMMNKNNIMQKFNAKNLLPNLDTTGYYRISLCKNHIHKKTSVHRLIALHFIPNPENKPEVNHINGIKTDNRIENLQWNTYSENIKHAYDNNLRQSAWKGKTGSLNNFSKKVLQFDLQNNFIAEYESITEATIKTNITTIGRVCSGKVKKNKYFIWRFKDED